MDMKKACMIFGQLIIHKKWKDLFSPELSKSFRNSPRLYPTFSKFAHKYMRSNYWLKMHKW